MNLWVWRGIRLEVPDDWEMLLFSREARAGRCAFADRYQFRLEFSWRQGNARPDMERMLSDYLGKLRLEGTVPDAREVRNGPFRGIEGRQEGIPTSRFGLYLERLGCLVELVFLWPEARDADLERAVLGSIEPELPWGLAGLRPGRADPGVADPQRVSQRAGQRRSDLHESSLPDDRAIHAARAGGGVAGVADRAMAAQPDAPRRHDHRGRSDERGRPRAGGVDWAASAGVPSQGGALCGNRVALPGRRAALCDDLLRVGCPVTGP